MENVTKTEMLKLLKYGKCYKDGNLNVRLLKYGKCYKDVNLNCITPGRGKKCPLNF